MAPSMVDRVSRALATRRTVLERVFPGGLLAALGLAGMTSEAAAAPCPKSRKRCKKKCIPKKQCCTNAHCRPAATGKVCRNGRCVCGTGTKSCQGRCIGQAACCGGCPSGQICDSAACTPPRCRHGGPCRVFITSGTYDGNLGLLAGADAKCQALANASPRTQDGTYKAWLSESEVELAPAARFTNIDQTGPYVLVDNLATVIATNWAGLTDGQLSATILADETGQPVDNPVGVWTNTEANGESSLSADICLRWQNDEDIVFGAVGTATFSTAQWSKDGALSCETLLRLYCFEQG